MQGLIPAGDNFQNAMLEGAQTMLDPGKYL